MPVLLWSHGGILCATTTLQYVMRLCSVQFGLLAVQVQAYVPYSRFEFCITEPEFLEYLIMDHIDVNHPLDTVISISIERDPTMSSSLPMVPGTL